MVQVLQGKRQPTLGERFGRAFSSAAQYGAPAVAKHLSSIEENRQRDKTIKDLIGRDLKGLDPETQSKILLEELGNQNKRFQMNQQQKALEDYNRSLGRNRDSTPTQETSEIDDEEFLSVLPLLEESLGREFSPQEVDEIWNEYQKNPRSKESEGKVDPLLASSQVERPYMYEEIPAHKKAVSEARKEGFNSTKEGREERRIAAKQAKHQKPFLAQARKLAQSGKVSGAGPAMQSLLSKIFPNLKGADVKELERAAKEITVSRFRQDFGGKPSASEFFYLTNVYFRPGDPKESILRNIEMQEYLNDLAIKEKQVEDQILRQYGEYPLNLDELIEDRMEPYKDELLTKIGYYDWLQDHPDAEQEALASEGKKGRESLINIFGF